MSAKECGMHKSAECGMMDENLAVFFNLIIIYKKTNN